MISLVCIMELIKYIAYKLKKMFHGFWGAFLFAFSLTLLIGLFFLVINVISFFTLIPERILLLLFVIIVFITLIYNNRRNL